MWFRIILDGAGDVYHDAPSEPGLGSDPYDRISCGGLPAVLLLMRKCYMASERRLLIMAAVFFISSNLTLFPVWKTNIISLFIKQ